MLLIATAVGMTLLLALLPAAGHDQLWFLLMAKRWLAGAQLYGPEAFDSNPPGIVWLSALAVLLGKLFHVPASAAGKFLTLFGQAAAFWLIFRLVKRSWLRDGRSERLALLFAGIVLFDIVPARDFGQREHLLSFFVLPYLVTAAMRWPKAKITVLRILTGLMAGVGICLKPHHALIPLVVEGCLLAVPIDPADTVRERIRHLFRPEPLLILGCGLAFLAAVRHFTPLYFSAALPLVQETYWAIGHLSVPQLAWEAIELCTLGAISIWMFVLARPRSATIRVLLVGACAASLTYFAQGTGWYYQQLPAICYFGAALTLMAIDWAREKSWHVPAWVVPATAAVCTLALILTAHFTGYPFTQDRAFAIETPDPALFSSLTPGTSVAMLTTSVDEAMMPVESYGLVWAQRTNNLWLLPAIFRSERPSPDQFAKKVLSPENLAALDDLQHRWMMEDLQRWRPVMVLVERCQVPGIQCQELEDRHDNLLEWFLRDQAFRAIWSNYRYAKTQGRFDVYMLRHQ